MKQKVISILTNCTSWMLPYSVKLSQRLSAEGYEVHLVTTASEIADGDIAFFLSCFELVKTDVLSRNRHNIVVHASDLPQGKGWSPVSQQILEGKNRIPLTLFEANEKVDAGPYYLKDVLQLDGSELLDDWHRKLGEKIIEMCLEYTAREDNLVGIHQQGESSFYARRYPEDSRLDIHRPLIDQFNLLRIVDNERYPAFFELEGQRYELSIRRVPTDVKAVPRKHTENIDKQQSIKSLGGGNTLSISHIREATNADVRSLYHLSNDPTTRAFSIHTGNIAWEEHVLWCHHRLRPGNLPIYIAEAEDGDIMGELRLDQRGDDIIVSITLAPPWRGRGVGRELIRRVIVHAGLKNVVAYIREENQASLRAFKSAGFADMNLRCLCYGADAKN